jgi:lipopolysaccharide export LptBFGC system permease protein LptF
MSTLDRYILRSLVVDYFIALAVMLSLYVLLDMFVNMDEFTEHGYPLWTVVRNIASYYAPQVLVYFAQLSGVITLFACMATIVRMRRQNELTAVLASGVSLHRIAAPVAGFALLTTILLFSDTEWAIPAVAHRLARDHDDVDGRRAYEVLFLKDRQGALISAGQFHPTTREVGDLLVMQRNSAGQLVQTLEADRAEWEAPPMSGEPGRWLLERGRQRTRVLSSQSSLGPQQQAVEDFPTVFATDLGPETIEMQQTEGWLRFLSLAQLRRLIKQEGIDHGEVLRAQHGRIAAPILGFVMVLLGLPFFLDRSPTTLLSDSGKCMVVCGLCYAAGFIGQGIRTDFNNALPYWIPIFVFATLAMVLIDRIRT